MLGGTHTEGKRLLPRTHIPGRGVFWLQIAVAVVCCALSLLFLLPLARFGEQPVTLKVSPYTCGATACIGDDCTQTEWVGLGTLRVTSVVNIPLISEVDPESASVAIMDAAVRLRYFTKQRDFDLKPGDPPIPACLMPVSLSFEVSGLSNQTYTVTTTGFPRYIERLFVGFAIALLFIALLLFAMARTRARRQQAASQR